MNQLIALNKFIALVIIFFSSQSFAVEPIKLDSVGLGAELNIVAAIQLPKGQKLTQQAPSNISIYEQEGKDWVLAETVNINDFFSLTEMINFKKPIKLKSDSSKLKVTSSLFHCPRFGRGICVIDDFEGLVERNPKKKETNLRVALEGSTPK